MIKSISFSGTKLSEECCKYGAENTEDNILAKAASIYGDARKHAEKEQEDLNRLLFSQVTVVLLFLMLELLDSSFHSFSFFGTALFVDKQLNGFANSRIFRWLSVFFCLYFNYPVFFELFGSFEITLIYYILNIYGC